MENVPSPVTSITLCLSVQVLSKFCPSYVQNVEFHRKMEAEAARERQRQAEAGRERQRQVEKGRVRQRQVEAGRGR